MEEIQRPLEVIEAEINDLQEQFKANVYRWGKLALGENATRKQIANYVSGMLGIESKMILELMTSLKVVSNE